MTLDLRDKKIKSKLTKLVKTESTGVFRWTLVDTEFYDKIILDFQFADFCITGLNAEYLIDYDWLTENTDYQAKYLTSLIPEVDFNHQTDFNLIMYL